jgi:hypothetical protein
VDIGRDVDHCRCRPRHFLAEPGRGIGNGCIQHHRRSHDRQSPSTTRYVTGGGQGCFTQASFQTLSAAKAGLVVAPIDMGARILITSHHSVLAAPYHRNNQGNLAAYQVFLLPQGEAKARAVTLSADYIAICRKSAEVAILSREGPKGLMSDLDKGKVPDWLTALPTPKGSDVTVYAVKQP